MVLMDGQNKSELLFAGGTFLKLWLFFLASLNAEELDEFLKVSLRTSLCPYSHFCTSNASEILSEEDHMSCCIPCSCADDCWRRGNCCPDKRILDSRPPTEECLSTLVKRKADDNSNYNGIHRNIKRYFVVNSCLNTEKNVTIAEKCKGNKKTTLEDYAWVSDGTKIYQNKYCAECNGISEYTMWNLMTTCEELLSSIPTAENNYTIPDSCDIINYPSEGDDFLTSMCYDSDISECNTTGLWESYDEKIHAACNAFNLTFLQISYFKIRVYRNVFCYLCNKKTSLQTEGICSVAGLGVRDNLPPFWAIFDWNVYRHRDLQQREMVTCAVNKFADPYTENCYDLQCPKLSIPLNGKCREALTISKVFIKFIIVLYPSWEGFSANFYNNTLQRIIGERISRNLFRKAGFLKAPTPICSTIVSASHSRTLVNNTASFLPDFFISTTVVGTNENYNKDLLLNKIASLSGEQLLIKIPTYDNGFYLPLKMNVDARDEEAFEQIAESFFIILDTCFFRFTIHYCDLRCPSIKLNISDLREMYDADDISSLVRSSQSGCSLRDKTDTGLNQALTDVCLNDYLALAGRYSGKNCGSGRQSPAAFIKQMIINIVFFSCSSTFLLTFSSL